MMLEGQDQSGWVQTSTGISYPPEPWFLGGALTGSVFRVPTAAFPERLRAVVPADHRLITVGGQLPVTVAFVHYTAGGVLSYEELLVSVPVRAGWRARVCVLQIWVDSARSRAGGRALWNIPKDMACFDYERNEGDVRTTMRDADGPVATIASQVRGSVLPGRWQIPLTTAQCLDGNVVVSSNSIIGRVRRTRAAWSFHAQGPLSWLNRARPMAHLMIDDAIVAFGERVVRR